MFVYHTLLRSIRRKARQKKVKSKLRPGFSTDLDINSIDDLIHSCRVCMAQSVGMTEIFIQSTDDDNIRQKFQYCTGVKLSSSDKLPSKICSLCLRRLDTAYKFKTACLLAENTYKKLIEDITSVKTESNDDKEFTVPIKEDSVEADVKDFSYSASSMVEVKIEAMDDFIDENIKEEDDDDDYIDDEDDFIDDDDEDEDEDDFIDDEDDEDIQPIKKLGKKRKANTKADTAKKPAKLKRKNDIKNELKKRKTKGDKMKEEENASAESDEWEGDPIEDLGPVKERKAPTKSKSKTKRCYTAYLHRLYCQSCELSFKNKEQSDEHKILFHPDTINTWFCEVCGKMLAKASKYNHIESHFAPVYACSQCEYKANSKSDLSKHVMIHNDIKKYQCEYCTNRFRTSSNLNAHIKRNHQGLKNHKCECGKMFFDKRSLLRHQDMHNNIKRFTCDVCHAKFVRRRSWKKHLLKQHGVAIPRVRPGRRKMNLLVGSETVGPEIPQD